MQGIRKDIEEMKLSISRKQSRINGKYIKFFPEWSIKCLAIQHWYYETYTSILTFSVIEKYERKVNNFGVS